jgi:TonB family protein
VIHAEIGRGTNTPNATLRNEALRAARSTRFNAITSMNNQQGTITYRFKLK